MTTEQEKFKEILLRHGKENHIFYWTSNTLETICNAVEEFTKQVRISGIREGFEAANICIQVAEGKYESAYPEVEDYLSEHGLIKEG